MHDLLHFGRGLLRWLYNHNPFYVLSAALFFWGLYRSFDRTAESIETLGLMIGLVAYTVVLAVTAYLVIRLGKVWDDGRSLLVLILVMLLGISVSFDNAFRYSLGAGVLCSLGGLLFAVLLSEGLLRGLALRLPVWFRLPYHLILALFFLYPILPGSMQTDPYDPRVPWVLFAFPAVAGIAFLSLLPAIRRGPEYVSPSGSPWHWPWYPWVAFFVLGLGVCARSYYLSVSMHLAGGYAAIFAPYFLVPFLLAVNILFLEIGLVARSIVTLRLALLGPVGLVALAWVGCADEKVPLRFLATLTETAGATPLCWTMSLAAAFYLWAVVRRAPHAVESLTAALVLWTFVGRATGGLDSLAAPRGVPLLLAGLVQAGALVRRPHSARCLLAAACLVAGAGLEWLRAWFAAEPGLLSLHLALAGVLVVGAAFRDPFAKFLRCLGAVMLFSLAIAAMAGRASGFHELPPPVHAIYPALAIALALAYGHLLRSHLYLASAAATATGWVAVAATHGYHSLRQTVGGLDYLAFAAVSFLVAILISLMKVGPLRERLRRWRMRYRPRPAPLPTPKASDAD
jgi:hypothetical protein